MTEQGARMSQSIPLPEDISQATETALDKSKPQALPHEGLKPQSEQPGAPPASEEHPLSVGKP
jgi:hypothetical protein